MKNLQSGYFNIKNSIPGFQSKITVRHLFQPGDMGTVIHLHGRLYKEEYGYGTGFEAYVAKGIHEFYESFDETRDKVWICENNSGMCAFLLLQHRGTDIAQLRYFIVMPEARGLGLGKWLMQEFMSALEEMNYRHAYLWTTRELTTAARLYEMTGFKLTEEKQSRFFGKQVTEQRYDWFAVSG